MNKVDVAFTPTFLLIFLEEQGVWATSSTECVTHFLLRARAQGLCEQRPRAGPQNLWSTIMNGSCLHPYNEMNIWRKTANERTKEPLGHFIHLLYTIVRHKFKQQRIGKSLADQQNLYLLWGTRHVLGLPHSVHRPIWLYNSVHNSVQTSNPKTPKVTPSYQNSQHMASTYSDTHAHTQQAERAMAWGLSEFWPGACTHPCLTELYTDSVSALRKRRRKE